MTEGSPEPLGLTAAGNIAVHAPDAERVELCLFDGNAERRVTLAARTGGVWHANVGPLPAGQRYGLRAHGPWDPDRGLRFNARKLLLDPYATALDRAMTLAPSMFGHAGGDDRVRNDADSAPDMSRCVLEDAEPLPAVPRPETPWPRTVIYEAHIRGLTMRHPDVPVAIRGTWAGMAHPAVVGHLRRLGVTAIEVLPPAAWIDERHLGPLGLTNYWGYNTAAFCAPDPRLAPGGWAEIRAAVAALARAGIETIVDIVLNHSGEGDELGPTLSLRGLDNRGYYRLRDGRQYANDSGCGNTLALHRPPGLRLAMEALRAWAVRGGVHGFRFDLGTVLGRTDTGFRCDAPLLQAIDQDPTLRRLKRISEPWDVGPGGYQLGAFPAPWGEWNDVYRDDVRRFWRGDAGMLGPLGTRIAGSDDRLRAHRRPSRSVNFVVAHDGFTLADLVGYEHKHNGANGEGGRDGRDDNASWNNGAEGPTDDPAIQAARRADQVALQATLLLSRGTPMLLMGSEGGQTQRGNNNAYCQDGPVAWLGWDMDAMLVEGTRAAIATRLAHPALHDDHFLSGRGDVAWLRPDGTPMGDGDWTGDTLVARLTAADDTVLLILHRGRAAQAITVYGPWTVAFGTARVTAAEVEVPPRSVTVLTPA